MKQRGVACLGLAVGMSLSGARGDAAWLDDFGFRRLLTVTNLAAVGSDQTDFPILVKFTEATFSFQNANADGHDVRFTAADGTTPLSFERERHGAGAAEYWVKLPTLSASASTSFYVYYRLADAADVSDPTNVWDSNYCFVHHFEETSGTVMDSTANAVSGPPTGITQGSPGFIGSGASYASTGNSYVLVTNPVARPGAGTLEVWFKPTVLGVDGGLFRATASDGSAGYNVVPMASGKLVTYINAGASKHYCTGTTAVAVGEWNHVVDVYGATAPSPRKMYLNGELDATASVAVIPHYNIFQGRNYLGFRSGAVLDELRFSKTVRSADWIRAQNASMRDQLLSYGAEEGGHNDFLADYPFRRLLTVTNLGAISSTQVDFPVRVSLTSANFSFNRSNPNGYDVRFTAADGVTPLSYEREKHDPDAGIAEYWVKLPMLAAASPTKFYLYQRREASEDASSPTNVWDSDYWYVHHMEEASGSSKLLDSTAYGITSTPASVTLGSEGVIGAGVSYNGNYVQQDVSTHSGSGTYEVWYKPNAFPGGNLLRWSPTDGTYMYYVNTTASGKLYCKLMNQIGTWYDMTGTSTLTAGSWIYVAQVYGGAQPLRIFLNGVLDGSTNVVTAPHTVSAARQYIGFGLNGAMDEVRFSKVARSESYLKAQYASMSDRLIGYGDQEHMSPGTVILVR